MANKGGEIKNTLQFLFAGCFLFNGHTLTQSEGMTRGGEITPNFWGAERCDVETHGRASLPVATRLFTVRPLFRSGRTGARWRCCNVRCVRSARLQIRHTLLRHSR